jgi:hypothetical protein
MNFTPVGNGQNQETKGMQSSATGFRLASVASAEYGRQRRLWQATRWQDGPMTGKTR